MKQEQGIMPHFFINSNQIQEKNITISDKENYTHIARAMRARAGEKLLLIDENKIQYETFITEITNNEIFAKIEKSYPSARSLDFTLDLAQSPLNNDGQSFIIEKATELGINRVIPVFTDYCSVKRSVIEKKIPKCGFYNLPVEPDIAPIIKLSTAYLRASNKWLSLSTGFLRVFPYLSSDQ